MKKLILVLLVILSHHIAAKAQMTTRVVRDSLFIPWEMVYGSDDHIWFTQKNGYVCRMDPVSGLIDTVLHEPSVAIQSEGGMLGLALNLDFANVPAVYVAYDYMNSGTYTGKVVKYSYDPANKILVSPQVMIDYIGAANFHNGCRLLIIDNHLFITTGDATTPSLSQNTNVINGKILRLNLDGSIPTDNPKFGSPIWSWGHRNPQGMVYANNKLYQTEHGPNNDDEVNIIQKSRNYGWPNVEGYCNLTAEQTFCTDSNVVEPLKAWTPTIAVCGLDYYDHPMFPALQKSLIMATLKDARLYQLKLNSTLDSIASTSIISNISFGRLRDICISPDGRIYISTSNSNAAGTAAKTDKIIEIYDPAFVSVPKLATNSFLKIYPNPATTQFTVALAANMFNDHMQYSITNIMGQAIAEGILTNATTTISSAEWPAGVYIFKLKDGAAVTASQKLIKE